MQKARGQPVVLLRL